MRNNNGMNSLPGDGPDMMQDRTADVNALRAEIHSLKEMVRRQEHDLHERAKELNCLYGIASIVNEPYITVEEVLQGIVNLLPGAWQHFDVACSRIIWGAREFRTDNFKETPFRLAAGITSWKKHIGAVETFYLEDMPVCDEGPFLKEERTLIDAIGGRLGKLIEQKTIEAEIRKSEEKYRLLVENSHDIIYTLTPDGVFNFISPSWESLVGYPATEAAGKHFERFVHPDDVERCKAVLRKTVETGQRQTGVEYRVLHADGSCRWHVSNIVPLADDAGRIAGFEGSARDVTERKQAELRLHASDEMLNIVFDQTFQFMGLLDTEGRVIIANQIALDFIGQTEADVIGKPFWETPWWSHSRQEQDRLKKAIKTASGGEPVGFETTHADANGTIRHVNFSLRPSRNAVGDIVYLSAEGQDITGIKEKEAALISSERKYRNIFENAGEGIFQSTPEGRFIDVNPAMAKMCGFESPEEMVSSVTDIGRQHYVDPTDRDRYLESIRKQGTAVEFETRIYRKDHTSLWVSLNSRAVSDQSGKVLYYEGICMDITERTLAQEQIAREREKLRTLSDNAPFGMTLIDTKGKCTYVNAKFTELFGYRLSDVPDSETWFRKAFPNDEHRRDVMSVWAEDVENFKPGMQNQRIFAVTCSDGTQKIVSFISSVLASSDYLVTYEDITELRRLESNLRPCPFQFLSS